ncbi:MAG: hypothetical protein L3K17_01810 [Thermoplasmata archaeon]|nr:hypothetical protein [Thermoplasmata archaeon]
MFVCQKCLAKTGTCPSCGGSISQLAGSLIVQGAVFLAVILFIAVIILPGNVAGEQRNALAVTPVSGLSLGANEKVFGIVSPGQGAVIVVFSYTDSSGNSATGRHVENFWLNDPTGRVLVEMGSNDSSTPTIARGGEGFPPGVAVVTGFQYESNDSISIIGQVTQVGNVTAIGASAVAPNPTAFSHASATTDAEFFGIPSAICVSVILAGVFLTRSRLRWHELNLPKWTLKRPKELSAPPPADSIEWMDNAYLGQIRRIGRVGIAASFALIALFLVVVVSPTNFPDQVYFGVLVGTPIGLIFAAVSGYNYWNLARRGIRRLGASSQGVYLDYARVPPGARTFIAWTDIRELEAPRAIYAHGAQIDTPLGSEYLQLLSTDTITFLRTHFEAARVPYRSQSAPLRPSVESLLGTGPPASVSGTVWTRNPLARRWVLKGALLLVLQIPLAVLGVIFFERYGLNQGEALFFLPTMFGAQLAYQGSRAIRAVGISAVGFSLRESAGERTIPWSEVAELTPFARGVRYKSVTGFAESFARLDRTVIAAIVDGLNQARGVRSLVAAPNVPPAVAAWVTNPLHGSARDLLVLMVALPLGVSLASTAWLVLTGNPNAIFGIFFPVILIVFGINPLVSWRASPVRIALTSDAIFVDYGRPVSDVSAFNVLPFSQIATASASGPSSAPRGLGLRPIAISFRTVAGINLAVGPVSPTVARAVQVRFRPDQLQEWKLPG